MSLGVHAIIILRLVICRHVLKVMRPVLVWRTGLLLRQGPVDILLQLCHNNPDADSENVHALTHTHRHTDTLTSTHTHRQILCTHTQTHGHTHTWTHTFFFFPLIFSSVVQFSVDLSWLIILGVNVQNPTTKHQICSYQQIKFQFITLVKPFSSLTREQNL
jgi:hypothetical protein